MRTECSSGVLPSVLLEGFCLEERNIIYPKSGSAALGVLMRSALKVIRSRIVQQERLLLIQTMRED